MEENGAISGISEFRLRKLQAMIMAGNSNGFYDWADWERTRAAVLALDNHECQLCKARHRYRKAILVHHVKHLTDRPDLALSVFDPDTGERQLVSLCRACHEEQHPERRRGCFCSCSEPLTVERWD